MKVLNVCPVRINGHFSQPPLYIKWNLAKLQLICSECLFWICTLSICFCTLNFCISSVKQSFMRMNIPHCVKSVHILNFSSLCFPGFGLNTEIYSVNIRIQYKCYKVWTRKMLNTDTIYSMTNQIGFAHLTHNLLSLSLFLLCLSVELKFSENVN